MQAEKTANNAEAWLFRRLSRRRGLAPELFLLAILLSSTALFSGFQLDDYIARYIYTDDPYAEHLFELWSGGYGSANGVVSDNHWLVEEGWAPWWIKDDLLLRLYRPIGVISHYLDALLFPDSAPLQHLHNLLWMGLLAVVMTRTYRIVMPPLMGGMAALLFTLDHTHGFTVGYICNRHALIAGTFAALCLGEHLRYRQSGALLGAFTAPLFLILGLLTSESTVAIMGYLGAYALVADRGNLIRRGLTMVPYLAVVVLWRGLYNAAGYGAHGSGMYLDPVREPLVFLLTLLQRAPVLLLGQYLAPPAEFHVLLTPGQAPYFVAFASVFAVILLLGLWPIVRDDRLARFWFLGSILSMVPAASAYPHNRQLLFVSFGAMALIAQLWHFHAVQLKGRKKPLDYLISGGVSWVMLLVHLVFSPLVLPFTTVTGAMMAPLHRNLDAMGDAIAGKRAIFVTAPDYFAVKLILLQRRIIGGALPERVRSLHFGPETVTVERTAPRSLVLHIEGGILTDHLLELYRDSRIPTPLGPLMSLKGMQVTVQEANERGLAKTVQFDFDDDLDSGESALFYWDASDGFRPFKLPLVGEQLALPPARLQFEF